MRNQPPVSKGDFISFRTPSRKIVSGTVVALSRHFFTPNEGYRCAWVQSPVRKTKYLVWWQDIVGFADNDNFNGWDELCW